MSTPRLIELIESALTAGGFDGLVVSGECGCLIGDLSPGDCISNQCHAGYKHVHSGTGDWIVSTSKEPPGDDEIQRVVDQNVAVIDEKNGLMWAADDVTAEPVTFAEAEKACAALRTNGHTDWRLPTIQELLTVVDYARHEPAADTDLHRIKPASYWTSTKAAWSAGVRWVVVFHLGYSYGYGEGYRARVRAVRSWSGPLAGQ